MRSRTLVPKCSPVITESGHIYIPYCMSLVSPTVWTQIIVAAVHISVFFVAISCIAARMYFRAYPDIMFMRWLATLLFAQQLSVQDFSQRLRRFTSQHSFDSMAANMTASQQLDAELRIFLATVEDNRSPDWLQSADSIFRHMEVVIHVQPLQVFHSLGHCICFARSHAHAT